LYRPPRRLKSVAKKTSLSIKGETEMPQNTLRVVARIIARPDSIDGVRSCLSDLIEPTRKEPGCISYELLQNKSDPSDFTFVEEWESDDAMDAHLKTDHLQKAISRVTGLIAAAPDIRKYSLLQ
jgi:quinol monooxygenase YgiN